MMRPVDYGLRVLALALVHVATGLAALSLHAVGDVVSLLWAPGAIGLAIVILYGRKWWPGIAIGTFLIATARGMDLVPAIAVSVTDVLEVVVGNELLRMLRFRPELDRVRDVVTFVVVCFVISLVSATTSVTAMAVYHAHVHADYEHIWRTWWWSHLSSDLIIAPLILTLGRKQVTPWTRRRWLEAAILVGVEAALVLVVLGRTLDPWLPAESAPYTLLPMLIWAGVRFGPRGAAMASFGASTCAICAQTLGLGPFDRVIDMQSFITISTMSTLVLSALTSERIRAVERKGGIEVAALDAIVTIDQNARVLELNPAAEELLGLHNAIGKDVTTLVVPERLAQRFRLHLRELVRTGVGRGLRFRTTAMHAGTKREFPVEIAVAPTKSNVTPLFTGFIRDISAEVSTKQALEQQVAERTTALFEANATLQRKAVVMQQAEELAHLGSFDFDIPTNQLRWSDELYRIYGRDPAAYVPTFTGLLDAVHPDDRDKIQAAIEGALETLRPFSLIERIVRPNGKVRVLQTSGRILADHVGKACRILGCCQDITERAERDALSARLVQLVTSSDDAIIGLAPGGEIETWNTAAEKMFGWKGKEVIGRLCSILIPEAQINRLLELLEAVRAGEHLAHYELTHQRKDGTLFEASVTTSAVLDTESNVVGLSKVIRDVTNERRVEAQMRTSLREKEVLLREIHHRVKNNLQVIASLLNLQMAGESNALALKGLIESQNRIHSMALVHQLLYQSKELARIEFGEYLTKVTRRLVDTYNVDAARISVDVASTSLRLDIDHAIPCGLLVNELVTNALTHAFPGERGGHIRISLEREGDKVVLTVADDGVGIPANVRIDEVQTFGLRIARTLTAQLDGTLTLTRDNGTVARVVFPTRAPEGRE